MAVKASCSITISVERIVDATYRFYKLQSSTAAVPAKPTSITTLPPSGWSNTEPSYTDGSTNSLYTVDLTVFTDGTFSYTDVSLSTSYEAAKTAYNKALQAQDAVDGMEIGGRNLARKTGTCGTSEWVLTRSTAADGVLTLTPTTSSAYGKYKIDYLDYDDYKDADYTLSFDARYVEGSASYSYGPLVAYPGVNLATRIGNTFSSSYDRYRSFIGIDITNEWKRYSITFNIPASLTTGKTEALTAGNFLTFQFASSGSKWPIQIRRVKLERGTKATDWTPAPEDVDEAVQRAQETADNIKVYTVEASVPSIKRDWEDTTSLTPSSITFTAYCNSNTYTGGKLYVDYQTTDSGSWTSASNVSGGSITYTINTSAVNVRCRLVSADNTQLAVTIIPVLKEATALTQSDVFNKLTNNGALQGLFMQDGDLYLNGQYIKAGTVDAEQLKAGAVTAQKISVSDLQAIGATLAGWTLNSYRIYKIARASEDTLEGARQLYLQSKPSADGEVTDNTLALGVQKYINGSWRTLISFNYGGAFAVSRFNDSGTRVGRLRMSSDGLEVEGGISLYSTNSNGSYGFFANGSGPGIKTTNVTSGTEVLAVDSLETGLKYLHFKGSSSKRYKDPEGDVSYAQAKAVLDIPVVNFRYKEGYLDPEDELCGKPMPGLYAEDVEEAVPEAVYHNADGLTENWNERIILPLILRVVQEQQKEIERLREIIEKEMD